MFIVSKGRKTVRNFSEINTFWLEENKIKIGYNNGWQYLIGEYDTKQEAAEMFVELCNAIEQGNNFFRMYKTGNSETKVTDEMVIKYHKKALEDANRRIRKLQKENAELAEQKSNLERNLNMVFTANILSEKTLLPILVLAERMPFCLEVYR